MIKTVVSILLGLCSASAMAVTIGAGVDQPTCFKRVYSDAHMKRNPKQLLSEMYVKLSWKTTEDKSYTWMAGEVVGVSKGAYYGNTAYCSENKDGSVGCSIDCDGGSFGLKQSARQPGSVNFIVTKDYYFPLYKDRMSSADDEIVEGIQLRDEDNRIYRLEPATTNQCDGAIEKIVGAPLGGC